MSGHRQRVSPLAGYGSVLNANHTAAFTEFQITRATLTCARRLTTAAALTNEMNAVTQTAASAISSHRLLTKYPTTSPTTVTPTPTKNEASRTVLGPPLAMTRSCPAIRTACRGDQRRAQPFAGSGTFAIGRIHCRLRRPLHTPRLLARGAGNQG